jgi:hypothetical protein
MSADRWVATLPWRWARKSLIFGTIISFAPLLGTPNHIERIVRNGGLFWMSLGWVFIAVPLTVIFFVLGLWARAALSRGQDKDWTSIAESIALKWTIGAVVPGLLVTLAVVFALGMFRWGSSFTTVAQSVVYAGGVFGSSLLLGFLIGLVSRRGLRRAISNDEATSRDSTDAAATSIPP